MMRGSYNYVQKAFYIGILAGHRSHHRLGPVRVEAGTVAGDRLADGRL